MKTCFIHMMSLNRTSTLYRPLYWITDIALVLPRTNFHNHGRAYHLDFVVNVTYILVGVYSSPIPKDPPFHRGSREGHYDLVIHCPSQYYSYLCL